MTTCACGGPTFRGSLCAQCMDRFGVVKVLTNTETGAVTMLDRHGRDVLAVPAPAPEPDELTVDDVLGVLDHSYTAVHLGSSWWIRRAGDAYELAHDCIGGTPLFTGAFVDCWREAKRRGLLG